MKTKAYWEEIAREEQQEEIERLEHELDNPVDFVDCSTYARRTLRDPAYAWRYLEKNMNVDLGEFDHE